MKPTLSLGQFMQLLADNGDVAVVAHYMGSDH